MDEQSARSSPSSAVERSAADVRGLGVMDEANAAGSKRDYGARNGDWIGLT
jgi:hypothetical protein